MKKLQKVLLTAQVHMLYLSFSSILLYIHQGEDKVCWGVTSSYAQSL